MSTNLADVAIEQALLASVLISPHSLNRLLVEGKLKPEDFAADSHRIAFQAMVAIADRGTLPDTLTLAAELERFPQIPDAQALAANIANADADATQLSAYARRVRDLRRRRDLRLAGALVIEAADLDDREKLARAESILTTPAETELSTWSPSELAEEYYRSMDEPDAVAFKWPFSKLNDWTGGGLRSKQIVLIGGWTANGKSIIYDQILECLAGQGLRVHSYINEMSKRERMDRTVARLSGVPFADVYRRKLEAKQSVAIQACLSRISVGMTECAGWTAPEIARHIRWNRWDVAGVDILHEIAHREERDLAEIAQVLRAAAKQAGCVLIACVHLNDNRVTSPQRPVPVMRDVRGSGMLVRGADVVLMIHRDDDADGVPTDDGVLIAAKIRQGSPNVMKVMFDPQRMRFLPTEVAA